MKIHIDDAIEIDNKATGWTKSVIASRFIGLQ